MRMLPKRISVKNNPMQSMTRSEKSTVLREVFDIYDFTIYNLRFTIYDLRITNYDFRFTILQFTNYDFFIYNFRFLQRYTFYSNTYRFFIFATELIGISFVLYLNVSSSAQIFPRCRMDLPVCFCSLPRSANADRRSDRNCHLFQWGLLL